MKICPLIFFITIAVALLTPALVHTSISLAAPASQDSNNVEIVGTWTPPGGSVHDIAVSGDYAYVVAYNYDLRIINIADPQNSTEVGNYGLSGQAISVTLSGNYAYVGTDVNGLFIIDVSDPQNPTLAGEYFSVDAINDIIIAGNYAYLGHDWFTGLVVLDVSDPANVIELDSYDTPGHAKRLSLVGNYMYVADGASGLRIVDVSDPLNISEVGFWNDIWNGSAMDVVVSGDRAYMASNWDGLIIIDVQDPANPVFVNQFETPGATDADTAGLSLSGNLALIADGAFGLRIIDISDENALSEVGYYNTPGWAYDTLPFGDNIYVADGPQGFQVLHYNGPPDAYFSVEDRRPFYTPEWPVKFKDESTGAITDYLWEFGDGNTSTEENPWHVYDVPGDYDIVLTVTGPGGDATWGTSITVVSCEGPTGLDICKLEKGDILVEMVAGYQPVFFTFIGTYWTHVGFYDGKGNVLHAAGSAPAGQEAHEVRAEPIYKSSFYGCVDPAYTDCEAATDWEVIRLKPGYPNRQQIIDQAVSWAYEAIDDPDVVFLDIFSLGALDPFNKSEDQTEFYCSLFVWHAYYWQAGGGIDLDYPSGYLWNFAAQPLPLALALQHQVLPDDLYASSIGTSSKPPTTVIVDQKCPDCRKILFTLLSPADLTVIDEFGNITGIDPATGQAVAEIPGSFYSGPDTEPEWVSIPNMTGLITTQVTGTGTGDYGFGVQLFHDDMISSKGVTSATQPGQVDVYEIEPPPDAPSLIHLIHKSVTNQMTPTLTWNTSEFASSYRLQIGANYRFTELVADVTTEELTYTMGPLHEGTYFWRVRALNTDDVAGPWSAVWTFKIDTDAPPPPPMRSPLNGATLTNPALRFHWGRVAGADSYVFQLAADEDFEIVLIDDTVNHVRYDLPDDLLPGDYWWRVASVDEAGNRSEWSIAQFTIATDTVTPPPTDAPPPVIETPVDAPTLEPAPPAQWIAPTQAPPPGKDVPDSDPPPTPGDTKPGPGQDDSAPPGINQ